MSNKGKHIQVGPHAASIPVDDTVCQLGEDTIQGYLEKLCGISKPSYSWGRSGNTPNNTWLINNEVPSNRVGTPFNFNNGVLSQLWVGNENVNTFSISVYEHDGDEVNLTLLTTVTVTAARSQFFTEVDFGTVNITKGKQIAVRITSGNAKNPGVFAQIAGSG